MEWRSIPIVGNWIADLTLGFTTNRAIRKLEKDYDPKIKAAEASKKEDEIGMAYSAFYGERDDLLEPLRRRNSAKAVMAATKLGIPVPRYTKENEEWTRSIDGRSIFLTDDAYKKLRREIREEQRSSFDEFRKWGTTLLALAGFGLALMSLLVKQKQPDPCARNYYRNDAGACVFALTPPPQPQAASAKTPITPAKPVHKISTQTKNTKKKSANP